MASLPALDRSAARDGDRSFASRIAPRSTACSRARRSTPIRYRPNRPAWSRTRASVRIRRAFRPQRARRTLPSDRLVGRQSAASGPEAASAAPSICSRRDAAFMWPHAGPAIGDDVERTARRRAGMSDPRAVEVLRGAGAPSRSSEGPLHPAAIDLRDPERDSSSSRSGVSLQDELGIAFPALGTGEPFDESDFRISLHVAPEGALKLDAQGHSRPLAAGVSSRARPLTPRSETSSASTPRRRRRPPGS